MLNEERIPINPIHFFQFSLNCYFLTDFDKRGFPSIDSKNKDRYAFPPLPSLQGTSSAMRFAMGWHPEGIEVSALIQWDDDLAVRYPEVASGDSLELFFDTRDVKSSGYNTRYCHHFFFLPEAVEGISKGEKTRFRTEDAHPLCDPQDLKLTSARTKTGTTMQIFIPSQCLHGYDPDQFNRLGFHYRLNSKGSPPIDFTSSSIDFQMEQQPSLWSSLILVN